MYDETSLFVTCFQLNFFLIIFYIKNDKIKKNLKTKFHQNIHQNTPNCTIKKNSLGACPRTPLAKRIALPCFVTCKFPNMKKNIAPPLAKSWIRLCHHHSDILFHTKRYTKRFSSTFSD